MNRYLGFVILFVAALLAFFAGAFTGNLLLLYVGVGGTLVLFVVSRFFIPRP